MNLINIFEELLNNRQLQSNYVHTVLEFGYLTVDEKVLARIKKYRKRFVAADANKDDKLSLDEFVAFQYMDLFPRMRDVFVDEVLAPLDLDKDGVVSLDEFKKGF